MLALQLLLIAAAAVCGVLICPGFVHMLQLESYKTRFYVKWVFAHPRQAFLVPAAFALGLAFSFLLLGEWGLAGSLLVCAGVSYALHRGKAAKKPLVWTPRVRRLSACVAVLYAACALASPYALIAAVLLAALTVALASLLMLPLEEAVKRWYFLDAKRRLAQRPDLIRIGITGSYGKTSTKFILATILSEKYRVLATRSSFNTPMGLTRVIREELTPGHEVFIAEMGAKHAGDIAELCALVAPQFGLLTSVGPQHLETFGDVQTVARTKYELIEALPPDGAAFFAGDGAFVDELFARTKRVSAFRSGLSGEPLHASARDIRVGPEGSSFTLTANGGESIECQTQLLGEHNIGNILLCASCALQLGLTLQQVQRGIARALPVEHRLQILPTGNGVTVIDDAFNASPMGTRAALAALAAFPGRKIIVTPGLVELGAAEAEENRAFGAAMAAVCDEVILVGKGRAALIAPGLEGAGYPAEHIHVVNDITGATAAIARLARAGDVVLFENDLPDNYAG